MSWPRQSSSTPRARDGGEVDEGVARELAHAGLREAEHVGQLVVALPLLEDQLDDRPLLVRQLVESGHMQGEL